MLYLTCFCYFFQMDSDSAVDLLKRLKDLPITLEILQKTRIGMSVNTLRKKSENADLQTQAKSLIKSWKKLLPGERNCDVTKCLVGLLCVLEL